jgi:hypothetical protein
MLAQNPPIPIKLCFSNRPMSRRERLLGVLSTNMGGGAHSIVPPILTANSMIRVLAMIHAPSLPSSFAANEKRAPVADRRQFAVG